MAKAGSLPIFLKAINIHGFKSFADKVKLELQHGMSVIVGPNGSGKSNVADAVRWVLGEQSAKSLRGTKMEDVIFAGSIGRRPVGMAEVSLVFDNTTGIFPLAFQEVTISRRVYRDGEGQYFINKVPSRLKDIQELLMDTGIGKEGFSIIGQGRVEEILNLKSEERRTLIEEASGITKFRARKKEASRRLEETKHNLERLTDIMQEIEGQLIPLAEQAEVAKQSMALVSEQRELEIKVIVKELHSIKEKLSNAQTESDTLKESLAQIMRALALDEGQNLEDKLALNKLEEELQQKQADFYQCEQEINALNHDINLRKERITYLNEQVQRLDIEILEGSLKQENLAEQIRVLEGKTAILQRTLLDAKVILEDKEKRLLSVRQNGVEQEAEQLKAELFAMLPKQTKISNELISVRHSLENFENQQRDLQTQKELTEQEVGTLRDSLENCHLSIKEAEGALEENSNSIKELEKKWTSYQIESENIERKRLELRRQIDVNQAKKQALQALDENLEGYHRGVREVMLAQKKNKPDCKGLCGTVADIIQVEEVYELAIETALGSTIQNVIAETMEDAKSAVNYLKKTHSGRATFLPLDVITGGKIDPEKLGIKAKEYLGIAVDLIKYENRYKNIMESLLGRIIIVKDIDSATKVAKISGYRIKIVTLDGEQINPGGALTGGSFQKKGANLLGRSREINDFQNLLESLEQKSQTIEKEFSFLQKEKFKLQTDIQCLTKEGQGLKDRILTFRTNSQSINEQVSKQEDTLKGLNLREIQFLEETKEFTMKHQVLSKELDEITNLINNLQEKLNLSEKLLKQAAQQAEMISEELTQEKIRYAKCEQELAQTTELHKQGLEKYQDIQKDNSKKKESLNQVKNSILDIQREVDTILVTLQEKEEVRKVNQRALADIRDAKESLGSRVVSLEDIIKAKRTELQTKEQKLHSNEVRIARLETEGDTLLKKLMEEYNLTWDVAINYLANEEVTGLLEQIRKIKSEIEGLGPVNQAAIEEYPKMADRFEFLKGQNDDLIHAGQSLKHLIDELDKTMSERFAEGFARVNEAFKEVFKEMFNGGSAELRLDDPENLLDTGVQIIAQPPGKKPQLLSLLSGGERALTAIALLFSLLKVKPSPICFLDEIEASLDDANVQRFAQYINKLSHSTQFLIISHRKGTMEAADVLFGIAMEESGVSKLLTVQLEPQEATIA